MATIFTDDFNRADNTNIGADYTEVSGSWEIVSNNLKLITHNVADDVVTYNPSLGLVTPADYEIEAQCKFSGGGGGGVGVAGRILNINNYYMVQLDVTYNEFRLYKKVSGSYTQIGSTYSPGFSEGTFYKIKLTMVGTSLKVYLADVERISGTDSGLTSTGKPGFRSFTTSGGAFFDDFAIYGVPATSGQRSKGLLMMGIGN